MGRKASRMPHTGTSFLEGLVAGAGRVSSVTGARLEVSSEPSLTLLLLLLLLVLLLLIDHHLMMLIIIWVPPHDAPNMYFGCKYLVAQHSLRLVRQPACNQSGAPEQ
ncbi:hypothetical protein M747DRAFT_6296 [Aspergillus niger ATCC 13496]|uniref:Uncharacterized protein n=1 Tax=Aspergillus niger ATCC 13496 TaxID=1353008 RepID=A0A370CG88_ASPNG|nr:hypothetical protein M747DRAFT_6296 [Aspergillus niger ATCC 13496]